MGIVRTMLSIAGLVAVAAPAAAQTWDNGPIPREGACFYQNANYRGPYFCVEAGENFDTLTRGVRDNISSIRIYGRTRVTVFDEPLFRGQSRQYDGDVQNLAREGWNDLIQSIRVQGARGNDRDRFGQGNRPFFGAQNPDAIVRRAYQDILERDPDPAGLRLYRSRIIDDGWTEQQVREALRNSAEYREKTTMTPAKAREIVRSAYLNVLNREPDPGSETYVARILRDRWTQQDVERELRRSPEFLNRQR